MANALSKITTRAKQIRKRHPGTSWKSAIKKAGSEYRSGKISGYKSRRRKAKARTTKRKKAVRRLKRIHRSEGKALQAIGSVSHHKGAIRQGLKQRIEKKAGQRELATKKSSRKKLTREISKLRSEYRRYC